MPLPNPTEYRRPLPRRVAPYLQQLSQAPENPQVEPEAGPDTSLRDEYMRMLGESPRMPRLRPDLGSGAFEDVEGGVQAPSRLARLLGAFGTGATAARHGPEAARQYRERYEYGPYQEERMPVEEQEAKRQERMKALLPVVQLEEQRATRLGLAKEATAQRSTEAMRRRLESADALAERMAGRRQAAQDRAATLAAKETEPYTLGPSERRFKGSQVIAEGVPLKETAAKDEYEKAVAEGWKGTRAEWKTLVADTYATGWTAMATPEGKTIWVHKSTGQVSEAPPNTRPQFTAAERMQLSDIDELIGRADRLREIADRNRGSVGWIQGKGSALKRDIIGVSEEVNELFRISDNMADVLLRARSGAQINEQEYKRLRTLVPNPRLSEAKFFSDLELFQQELQRIRARPSGAAPLITPREGAAAPGAGGQGSGAGTIHYQSGAKGWDIPASQAAEFEAAHPEAKRQ